MLFRKIEVRKEERALLFVRRDFAGILGPGRHRVFEWRGRVEAERFDLGDPRFDHRLAGYLQFSADPLAREVVAREFHDVRIGAGEVGLVRQNGVLTELLAPSTHALYWKGFVEVAIERVRVDAAIAVEPRLLREVQGAQRKVVGSEVMQVIAVPAHHVALLMVDGKVESVLQPGQHAFWKVARELRAEVVDTRLMVLEVAGQEILTRDKVALRVNLTAGYRVADVVTAYARQARPAEFLYKELQFGLRAAVGTRTLDELLENKGVIDAVVASHAAARIAGMGLELDSVGVKDIILPGDMKAILTRVVEAEKAAQSNVVRRREETAATRSLLNTAKVMEDNPIALRLKELETLEKVTEKIDRISVYGGLDGVLKDLVRIRA